MPAKHFSVSQDGRGTYRFEGELCIHDLDDLKSFLEGSAKDGQEISISLEKVRFIDTAALQLLIVFKRHFGFKVAAISSEVEDILSLCGLKTAFEL